jgi:HEAT repeat protein
LALWINFELAKTVHEKVEPAHADTAVPSDIPAEKSVEQLIQELKDPDEIVRSSAAGALGHSKSEKAVEPLILALKDNHVYVRHGAAWALGEILSEKAIDALRLALNDEDEITRGKAAEALGKIQGK